MAAVATTMALVVAGAGPAFADAPLSVIASVPVGASPYGVALSPDGTRAYVANQGTTTVSVIDTATDTVIATIGVAGSPTDVAVSPDGKRAYVTNQSRDIVSVIDTTTETLTASISTAYWGTGVYGVAVSPDGATVYATVAGDQYSSVGYVVVIDTATNTITNGIAVGRGPYSVAFSPDGSQAFTANSRSNTVDVINTATQKVTSAIPGLSTPESVAVSPDGTKAYIANTGNGTVGVIDTATDTVTASVPIGDSSTETTSVAVSPDGAHLYVANIADSVDEIDTATDTVATGLAVSGNPVSVAVSPGGKLVYVALNGGNALDVLASPPPTVTAVSAAQGPSSGGNQVTITGTNLSGATGITFGPGNPATNVSCTATSCTATAPAEPAGTIDVQVTTAGGTSTVSSADQYTYVAAPVVTAVSPSTGLSAGGTVVTVTGTGLSGASITFGPGNPATNVTCTATSCTATSPTEPVGTVDVQATTIGGTSATGSADQYTYIPPAPAISSISPASGPRAGGTTVTITGVRFTGTTGVAFGGTAAAFTLVSDTQITAVAPAGSAGTVDVTVTTASGASQTVIADQYTYVKPAPAVKGVSPATGLRNGGTTVTITGTDLDGTTAVDFGSTPATSFTVVSPTQITAVTPAHSNGTVDVTVTTDIGSSPTGTADQYTYVQPAPAVSAISPSSGPLAGGTTVTITGTDFDGTTAVSFGGNPATSFTLVSPTQITAIAPATTDVGAVDIAVTTPAGTSTTSAADQYTYTFPACSVAKANFRWHYATPTTGGIWSGTKTATCPGPLTMGPQAMLRALHIAPGTTLKAGYDFTVPGNNATQTLSTVHPQVVFTVACVDHSTPTQPTITITMPSGHYTFTGSPWIPNGDQNSTLTYQGTITIPDLCGGANLDLSAGGTFTTTLN